MTTIDGGVFSPWAPSNFATAHIIDLNAPRAASAGALPYDYFAGSDRGVAFSDANGRVLTGSEVENQFLVFQFGDKREDPPLLISTENRAKLVGSEAEPDVHAGIQLLSFRAGASEKIDDDSRATLRLNLGQVSGERSDLLTWAVAAGLDLYEQSRQPTAKKSLNADLNKALGNKPIEIPGGVGVMSFEVVKHREPPWWKKIFTFARSETAQRLISVLGFPALTTEAVRVVDELLTRISPSDEPEVLFRSRPMRLAFTNLGRMELTGGNERVAAGVLNRGFCLMARARDFGILMTHGAYYDSSVDMLLPDGVDQIDALSPGYSDPFTDVTYAVFKLGLAQTRLKPGVSYTSV